MLFRTRTFYLALGLGLIFIMFIASVSWVVTRQQAAPESTTNDTSPLGTMILIEYQDTVGLANFVNEMEKRSMPGLLMVTPEFVAENCEDIKEIIKHNIEIVGSNVEEPFWDMPYEEQKERMLDIKQGIESCTGVPVRIISSRYMASDMNTVKAAEDLGIPYITARGTTGTKATVYQPEGYNVKILSVSNIEWVPYKYGSLCDYSFYERAGSPEDMRSELDRAVEPLSQKEIARYGSVQRVTPVSHTNIGGYLARWMDMWLGFWDEAEVKWVDLDTLMAEPDWTMPLWQIPINMNNPYTEEKIRPTISYEDELKVDNPCAVPFIGSEASEAGAESDTVADNEPELTVTIFHNGAGSMCLSALEWAETLSVPVETYLESDDGFVEKLQAMMEEAGASAGVSTSYGYYPIIFVGDKAYSGFDDSIKELIETELEK